MLLLGGTEQWWQTGAFAKPVVEDREKGFLYVRQKVELGRGRPVFDALRWPLTRETRPLTGAAQEWRPAGGGCGAGRRQAPAG